MPTTVNPDFRHRHHGPLNKTQTFCPPVLLTLGKHDLHTHTNTQKRPLRIHMTGDEIVEATMTDLIHCIREGTNTR